MILDRGYCTIYSVTNDAPPGGKPHQALAQKSVSYYGELDFETAPVYQTERQEDIEVSTRVRVPQDRRISNHDVAVLSDVLPHPDNAIQYGIERAYHGTDADNGQPITDLTLKAVKTRYDVAGV